MRRNLKRSILTSFTMPIAMGWFSLLIVPIPTQATVPQWFKYVRRIEPLITTRIETERIFSSARRGKTIIGKSGITAEYLLNNAEISVTYSSGTCQGYIETFRVKKDVVLKLDVTLEKPVLFSTLRLDPKVYEKEAIPDLVGLFTYVNLAIGHRFNGSDRELRDFEKFPSSNQETQYKCGE